jgi:hypothetical protein
MQTVVSVRDLPPLEGSMGVVPGRFLLEGARFGLDRLTLVLGETAPGQGIPLHWHAPVTRKGAASGLILAVRLLCPTLSYSGLGVSSM